MSTLIFLFFAFSTLSQKSPPDNFYGDNDGITCESLP